MKRIIWVALVLAGLAGSPPARAEIGTIDPVPAATLLVPYFEVDLSNASGITTLFSVNNASAFAMLAKVTVWTDLGVPTISFPIYLTGYDVQTMNVRDLLNGVFPQTASDGQDLTDTISPQGALSQDINFASCSGVLPLPPLTPALAADLQAAHRGLAAATLLGGQCGGVAHGDSIARGYITVDVVNNCTPRTPRDGPAYFTTGGTGDATNQNALWGDVFYVDPGNNFAQGDTLAHVEASGTDPETSVAGQYTFYGRYVLWTAADNREPLATSFVVRFINGGAFTGGTSLIGWRDPKVNQGSFVCPAVLGVRPLWYPLGQEGIVVFDEQENPDIFLPPPFFPPPPIPLLIPFPGAAQRTDVGGPALPVPFTFGWLFLNLNQSNPVAGANPPEDPLAAQAWVMAVHDAEGRFSVGYAATQLDSATAASHQIPGM
jgi:hypothetical protein